MLFEQCITEIEFFTLINGFLKSLVDRSFRTVFFIAPGDLSLSLCLFEIPLSFFL